MPYTTYNIHSGSLQLEEINNNAIWRVYKQSAIVHDTESKFVIINKVENLHLMMAIIIRVPNNSTLDCSATIGNANKVDKFITNDKFKKSVGKKTYDINAIGGQAIIESGESVILYLGAGSITGKVEVQIFCVESPEDKLL